MSEKVNDERELIKKMSRLLLKGAKMLEETCPMCGTPLFYMKEVGLKYCPKCDIFVATPEELEKAKVDKRMIKIISPEDLKEEKKEKKIIKEELLKRPVKQLPRMEKLLKTSDERLKELDDAFSDALYLLIDKFIESVQQEKLSSSEVLELMDKLITLWKNLKA